MVKRWLLYLAVVTGCTVFYGAYRQWLAWLALLGVAFVPIFSLLVSLPAMRRLAIVSRCPAWLTAGQEQALRLGTKCPLPAPEYRYRVRIKNTLNGNGYVQKTGQKLPAEHCGRLVCTVEQGRIYDYLGLFWLKPRKTLSFSVIIRPRPIPVRLPAETVQRAAGLWKPKPGGGFSERHDLRLYRPGDNLNQVHWKLSAKTGKLILREPMIPADKRVLLEMELRGSADALDRKLGQLLFLSGRLLEQGTDHALRVLTGEGVQTLPVSNELSQQQAIDWLLCQSTAPEGQELSPTAAYWQYRIGGGEDEA